MLHQKPVRACTLLEAWTSKRTCNKFIHCFLNPITGSKKPSEVVALKALVVWHVWMCYLFLWRVWEGKGRWQTASYPDTSITTVCSPKKQLPNPLCCLLLRVLFICALFYYIWKISVAMKSFVQPPSLALPCIWGLRWSYVKNPGNIQACEILSKCAVTVCNLCQWITKQIVVSIWVSLHWIPCVSVTPCTIPFPST